MDPNIPEQEDLVRTSVFNFLVLKTCLIDKGIISHEDLAAAINKVNREVQTYIHSAIAAAAKQH